MIAWALAQARGVAVPVANMRNVTSRSSVRFSKGLLSAVPCHAESLRPTTVSGHERRFERRSERPLTAMLRLLRRKSARRPGVKAGARTNLPPISEAEVGRPETSAFFERSLPCGIPRGDELKHVLTVAWGLIDELMHFCEGTRLDRAANFAGAGNVAFIKKSLFFLRTRFFSCSEIDRATR